MKRWLFKLVLFLFLGAIVNIAVAWGCELTKIRMMGCIMSNPSSQQIQWWADNVPVGFVSELDMSGDVPLGNIGISDTRMEAHSDDITLISSFVYISRAGWPLLSLEGARWENFDYGAASQTIFDAAIPVEDEYTIIPLQPIWTGFVANTFFYTFFCYILYYGRGTARRIERRKRGHCIKCGYDLRETSGGCPECGWGREAEA